MAGITPGFVAVWGLPHGLTSQRPSHASRQALYSRTNRSTRCKVRCCAEQKEPPSAKEPAFNELRDRLKKVNVFLIGMMGSGKSTIGNKLAKGLGYKLLDTDQIIEDLTEQSIPAIFEEQGEEGFRSIEKAVLNEVQAFVGCIVSTGGGAVMAKGNWGPLQTGLVLWLDASPETLLERVKGDTNRPLLQTEDPLATLETLLEERKEMYSLADVTFTMEPNTSADETVFEVVRLLNNFIKSNPPSWTDKAPPDAKLP